MLNRYKDAFPFLYPVFLLPLSVVLLGLTSVTSTNETRDPNLLDPCKAECPRATTNEGVLICFDQLEKAIGDNGMMQSHTSCYKAVEEYQKISKAEEQPQEIDRTG